MSYEGYTEFLCDRGHYFCFDVYNMPETPKCVVCTENVRFCHSVDVTNGYDESHIDFCDAPKVELKEYDEKQHVDFKGNVYYTKIPKYIPTNPIIGWKLYDYNDGITLPCYIC